MAKERRPELFLPKDEFESSKMYNARLIEQGRFLNEVLAQYVQIVKNEEMKKERAKKEKIQKSIEKVELKIVGIGKYDADIESFSEIDFSTYTDTVTTKEKLPIGLINGKSGFLNKEFNTFRAERFEKIFNPETGYYAGADVVYGDLFEIVNYNERGSFKAKENFVHVKMIRLDKNIFTIKNIDIPLSKAKSFKENISDVTCTASRRLNENLTEWEYYDIKVEHPLTGSKYYLNVETDGLENNSPDIKLVPPSMIMRVAFIEENGNGFLDAKESGEFKVELTNDGEGPAKNVQIVLKENSPNKHLKFNSTTYVGDIFSEQTIIKRIKISARKRVEKKVNTFIINADELNGFSPDPTKVTFETLPFSPPELKLA